MPYKNISPECAAKLLQSAHAPTVIDVRTPDEFELYYIAGAINLDCTQSDFEKKISSLDKNLPYIVHCQSGARSKNALNDLQAAGFTNIYHMVGGLRAWNDAGLPTIFNWTI